METKVLLNSLEYKLKFLYNFENMGIEKKMDYEEEMTSFIPNQLDDVTSVKYKEFENIMKKNQHNAVIKKLKKLFDETWIMFLFIMITRSFEKAEIMNSSTIEEIDLANSYINSQTIFWRNVETINFFFVTVDIAIINEVFSKIPALVQLCIRALIDTKSIEEKKIYIQKKKDYKEGFFYKIVISYYNKINLEKNFFFNVENKFFRYPPRIVDYKIPKIKKEKKDNTQIIRTEWKNKSIICGPTFVRADVYDKSNPYGNDCFVLKDNSLREIFLETRFYPDIQFISHIREKMYNNLNLRKIEENILSLKKEIEKTFENDNWTEDTIKIRAEIQKKYSKNLEDKKTYIFLNHEWEDYYHLSSSNDYRGRKYYCSPLSFTHFKLSRFCFHYGYNGWADKEYFNWDEYEAIFEKLKTNLSKRYWEIIGFYLIGIGKFDKERKKNTETDLREILNKGLEYYTSNTNGEYEKYKENWEKRSLKEKVDAIEMECYFFGLKKLLEGDKTKRIIIKDATASGYQIQSYLIEVEDHEKLKYVNLGEKNIFIDTYSFIKTEYFKKIVIKKDLEKYFDRNIIKKFCMIIPYSAGFEECYKNIVGYIEDKDKEECEKLFEDFHLFIKKELWSSFGLKSKFSDFIKNFIKKNKYTVESETAIADLTYLTKEKKELDIKYTNKEDEKIRTTRSYYSTKEKIDEKKTLTAFSPNLTHFYDSDIIRILHLEPYNIKFASIHDAFIVSSFNCGKLVHSYGSIFKVKIRFKHEIPITCLI